MLINPVNSIDFNRNLNHINLYKQITFRSFEDFFASSPEFLCGEISEFEACDILFSVNDKKPISSGYTSDIYKHNNNVIKVPKKNDLKYEFHKTISENQNLKEYYALEKISEISSDIAVKPLALVRKNGQIYLIEEYVQGQHINKSNLCLEHIYDLLNKFLKLDTNCIFNCDLQAGNILLVDKNKTKLIDFGSFCIVNDFGQVLPSDDTTYKFFQEEASRVITKEANNRFAKTFLFDNYQDVKSLMDNPYINLRSNATNFEFRTLYPYLLENSNKEGFEFFKGYLKLKSEIYHSNLVKFLENLSLDEINKMGYSKEQFDVAKSNIEKAINYENITKKALANPTNDIIEIELAKMQLRTILNLHDSLGSKIENPKKLKHAYEQLVSLLENGIKNSNGDKKEYFSEMLKSFENKFLNYPFVEEQVLIPDKENLVNIFNSLKEEPKQIIEKSKEASSNKIFVSIILASIAVVGLINTIKNKVELTNKNK